MFSDRNFWKFVNILWLCLSSIKKYKFCDQWLRKVSKKLLNLLRVLKGELTLGPLWRIYNDGLTVDVTFWAQWYSNSLPMGVSVDVCLMYGNPSQLPWYKRWSTSGVVYTTSKGATIITLDFCLKCTTGLLFHGKLRHVYASEAISFYIICPHIMWLFKHRRVINVATWGH